MSNQTPVLLCGSHGSWLLAIAHTQHGPGCDLLGANAAEQLAQVLASTKPPEGELILLVDSASATQLPPPARIIRTLQQYGLTLRAMVLRRAVQTRMSGVCVRPASHAVHIANTESGVSIEVPLNYSELRGTVARVVTEAFAAQHDLDLHESPVRTDELLGMVHAWMLAPQDAPSQARLVLGGREYTLPREALRQRIVQGLRTQLEPVIESIRRMRGAATRVTVSASLAGTLGLREALRAALPADVVSTIESDDDLADAARELSVSRSASGSDVWIRGQNDAVGRTSQVPGETVGLPRWAKPAMIGLGLLVLLQGLWIARQIATAPPGEGEFKAMARRTLSDFEGQLKQSSTQQEEQAVAALAQAEKASSENMRRLDEQSKKMIAELERSVGQAKAIAESAASQASAAAQQEVVKSKAQLEKLVAEYTATITKTKQELDGIITDARKAMPDFGKPVEITGPLTISSPEGGVTVISGGSIRLAEQGGTYETRLARDSIRVMNDAKKSFVSLAFNANGMPLIRAEADKKPLFTLWGGTTDVAAGFDIYGQEGNESVSIYSTKNGGVLKTNNPLGRELSRIESTEKHGRFFLFASDHDTSLVTLSCSDGVGSINLNTSKNKGYAYLGFTAGGMGRLEIADPSGRAALLGGIWNAGGIQEGNGYFHPLDPVTRRGTPLFP